MPTKVKQINNWIIKKRSENDPYYNHQELNRNYAVYSPQDACMEDRLTLQEAEEFCNENTDFVKSPRILKRKREFLKEVKDGKWFTDISENKRGLACYKLKSLDNKMIMLWLSNRHLEGVSYCELDVNGWDIHGDNKLRTLMVKQSFVYNIGHPNKDENEDNVYDEDGVLEEDKMKDVILSADENTSYDLVTVEELNQVWKNIKNGNIEEYPSLPII